MKFLIGFLFLVAIFALLVIIFTSIGKNDAEPKKNVRNFKVRFDAAAEKYFIVNELSTYDEPVTNWLGRRVMYKEKPKAEFVVQKLNA